MSLPRETHIYKHLNSSKIYIYMAGKNRFEFAKELLEKNFKKGDEVGTNKLCSLIMINLGSDTGAYLKLMIETNLIKDIGNCHWEIL